MAHPRSFAFLTSLVSITALAIACASEFKIDQPNYDCDKGLSTCAGAGNGGNGGGSNGNGGVTGEGGGGMGGDAGAGAGGGEPQCTGDEGCAPANGSLCVLGKCTAPTGQCDATTRVVIPDSSREAPIDSVLTPGCFHRSFEEAFLAIQDITVKIAVYANELQFANNLTLRPNLFIEGHPSTAGAETNLVITPTKLDAPLITLDTKASLSGFSINGSATNTSIEAIGDGSSLIGPISIRGATLALNVRSGARAIVTGTTATPVVFSGNKQGIIVKPNARLNVNGDVPAEETAAGVVFDKNELGLLVEAGPASPLDLAEIVVSGATVKEHQGTGGGIQVESFRKVSVSNSFFKNNDIGLFLDESTAKGVGAFTRVEVVNNDFFQSLPAAAPGTVVCAQVLSDSQILNVGAGNKFPPLGENCTGTSTIAAAGCSTGTAFSAVNKSLQLLCP